MAQLKNDYRQASLSARDMAMLDYAAKLTLTPWVMTEADILGLRKHGFSDRDVLDITHVAAYFNFINRVADGLGLTEKEVLNG